MDYAISLAQHEQLDDAYEICEAARDSIAFSSSDSSMFLIHFAWGGTFLGPYILPLPEANK